MVRITTWNVNGIRNPFGYQPWRDRRTFDYMFDLLEADIVVMQELKIQRKDLGDDMVLVPGWDCYFSLPKHKKGYSGVAIYTRNAVCAPIRAEEGLLGVLCPPGSSTPYRDQPEDAAIGGYPTPVQVASLGVDPAALDAEGRCVVLEFPAFVIFGVYSPANSNGLRDDFRYGFLTALDTRIRNLKKMGKRVILTGDLNVSREEIDTAKAEESMRSEGITREDYMNTPNRRVFNQLLEHGRVPGARDEGREEPVLWDLCREMHPEREGMFTHWEQKINARPGNFGSRIDYVLCSIEMKDWFHDANIQEGLMGSDHCPVYASTKDIVEHEGEQVHMVDLMNAPGIFKSGVRLREYSPAQDLRPLSGRLLPEFDKRRSIKDMFSKARAPSKAPPLPPHTPPDLQVGSTGQLNPAVVPGAPPTVNGSAANQKLPLNAPEKRRASDAPPASSAKKSKTNAAASSQTRSFSGKGQQSLRGFFAPKASPAKPKLEDSPSEYALDKKHSQDTPTSSEEAGPLSSLPPPATPPSVRDPEASKESWVKLFSKKPPPRCESHDEPCKSFITKKPGVNCGRQFWTCSRPLGPSGQKENGTQWRCGTFIWSSDWNAPSPQK
ncbi:DNase I-like protein [Karstenula rhodostoma CBS 690.94]|uniref:DNA-(apurinic or apyrimidinic site) endonuclease 2 n=1 Tax=Karstenula rhodostoma CBS 690.94 TaxID=1392251 RepID=A0A9P4PBW3_9PLEO|nr:DNase I-like protein [Karstenula rhodostoma CBS 690.94]